MSSRATYLDPKHWVVKASLQKNPFGKRSRTDTLRQERRSGDHDQEQRPSRGIPGELGSSKGNGSSRRQWQSSGSTWQQIGQVVDAIGSGRKQLYAGKEYDYVFDVDVSEDMPPLKLPYNISGQL